MDTFRIRFMSIESSKMVDAKNMENYKPRRSMNIRDAGAV